METLRLILLFVHVLGFAALTGGLLVQRGSSAKQVNAAMRDGSGTAVVAGLLLVGVLEAGDAEVDHVKVAVKLVVGLVVLGLVMANLRKPTISQGLYLTLLALTTLNIAVAVFWAPAHT
ncbi:hypothetical protein [Nocardioides coralli]|uniref:hypothetical protein n=1 Tax=Nocardioides coralli TaxID=2872154 RepID=UPI001CA38D72|nr:hypothetical protein [Nocardioides coralli]QZY29877.1 hypothetical protein K6T13_04085 [Nocardioides coralli]